MAVKVNEDKEADAAVAVSVLKPSNTDNQFMYMAYYRTKKQPNTSPVKAFFRASSGMKAVNQLFTQTGAKKVDDFITLSLMEVLENNKYRDILNHDSTATTTATGISPSIIGSNVTSLHEFKERKNEVGKKDKKKHVKLSWMSEKLVNTGEYRILNKMKVLAEEGYVPKEVTETTITTPYRYGTSAYEQQREEYYNHHYGFGYGMGD